MWEKQTTCALGNAVDPLNGFPMIFNPSWSHLVVIIWCHLVPRFWALGFGEMGHFLKRPLLEYFHFGQKMSARP